MSLVKSKGNMYPWVSHTHTHLGGDSKSHGLPEPTVSKIMAFNEIRRKMLDMEIRKNDLRESIRKCHENIKRTEIEIKITEKMFWQLRRDQL